MSDRDITEALNRLVGSLDDEHGDWDDVVERSAGPVRPVDRRRLRRYRRPSRATAGVLLFAAAVTVTAVILLTFAAPWRGGPSILDRAAAAIAAPVSGQILHESIALHSGPFNPDAAVNVHVWLDREQPHRFRVTFDRQPLVEAGGTVGGLHALTYDSASDGLDPVALGFRVSQSDLDPVGFIRTALASGQAQLDGKTTIRGHEVLRIRVTSQRARRRVPIALYYVNARTYQPVRIVIPPGDMTPRASLHGIPLLFVVYLPYGLPDGGGNHFALIYDFATYRYLEPTADNRKLTNIQAQHPHAKIL